MKATSASTKPISSRMIHRPSPMRRYTFAMQINMRRIIAQRSALLAIACFAIAGCATLPPPAPPATACAAPVACAACPLCPSPVEVRKEPPLVAASFSELPAWRNDALMQSWPAFLASCGALRAREPWQQVCAEAARLAPTTTAAVRAFFEARFTPYRVQNPDGSSAGLVTGYYEPLLAGSRERRAPFLTPLYAPPDDLIVVDLAEVAPETRGLRLRGRLEGRKVVPYYSRAEIERGRAPLAGKEIVWVDDPIEAFFLQIQGSGRVRLPSGERLRLGYADQNGQPYRAIGRFLVESGELEPAQATMQGIRAWARAHPARLEELLNRNPSYVFFRELPANEGGPIGALGVALTAERSIAVDARIIPLGAPVYLATTRPGSDIPLARLTVAQDTGGAIRGAVRADYFWGFGAAAGNEAGRMRQQGRMWVLLPRGYPIAAQQ